MFNFNRQRRQQERLWAGSLCGMALTLALVACGGQSAAPSGTQATAPGAGEQEVPWRDERESSISSQALTTASTNLVGPVWTSATSGYGPIESNTSNGEWNGGDGRPLTINGRTFSTGYGVHTNSSMTLTLPTNVTRFTASVGVDDEVGARGSVVFQVFADGQKVYDSGRLTGNDGARDIDVDVTGKRQLQLVVNDAGDGIDYDHADWGNPMLLSTVTSVQATAQTGDKLYPADAVINVKTQYGAIPDDGQDDTAALQRAISENIGKYRTLYLPSGTYNVSDTLAWKNTSGVYGSTLTLRGQNQGRTILRLRDGAFGSSRRAVLYTASANGDGLGQGNHGFDNHISDLTVDTGSGNSGAVGIDYVANNCASIRNVTIRSGDGTGYAGLGMLRTWPGPLLVKHVRVEGFDYGLRVEHDAYTQTIEDLTLTGQRVAGIYNAENVLAIRGLNSTNSVPAVVNNNVNGAGVVTLLDSTLAGGSGGVSAVDNTGSLYIRNLTTSGYASAVKNRGATVPGATVNEYVSDPRVDPNARLATFRLDVQETPELQDNDLSQWANVNTYRTNLSAERDDSDAIQKAIDSGKRTVYFPAGNYRIGKTVRIRGNVERLVGFGATIDLATGSGTFGGSPQPAFRLEDGTPGTVALDSFMFASWNNSATGGLVWVEQASGRTLVLRDLDQMASGNAFYRNAAGAGKLFIENVATILPWRFDNPQDVWARQLNPENHDAPQTDTLITKNGGKLWLMGLKTEDPRTVLVARGGEVEMLGGILYPVQSVPSTLPAFVSENAKLKLSYTTLQYNNPEYQIHVKDTSGNFMRGVMPIRNHHAQVGLYYNQNAAPVSLGSGTGLKAEYYDNAYHTGDFTGWKTTRVDPTINFPWGYSVPAGTGLTSPDTYSVRWTGWVQAVESGSYTFSAPRDTGTSRVTVWVNGQQMNDGNGTVSLTAGQKYAIKVEYAHLNYAANMQLAWSLDGSLPQIIPASQLYPAN